MPKALSCSCTKLKLKAIEQSSSDLSLRGICLLLMLDCRFLLNFCTALCMYLFDSSCQALLVGMQMSFLGTCDDLCPTFEQTAINCFLISIQFKFIYIIFLTHRATF